MFLDQPITITYYDGGNRPMNMYLKSIALGNRSERNALSLIFADKEQEGQGNWLVLLLVIMIYV